MPTVRVTDVIRSVEYILKDHNVRWPRLELQSWLNEAYLNVVTLRPDASATTGVFACEEGTKQSLRSSFPTALSLIDVSRTVSPSGTKRAVRQGIRAVLDEQHPEWHNDPLSADIRQFFFDLRDPVMFFVYPPASAEARLEVVFSDTPVWHTLSEAELDPGGGSDEVIRVSDTFFTPLVDWVLYRAYAKDAESGANEARAAAAYQAFMASIGNKSQSDTAAAPAAAKNRGG